MAWGVEVSKARDGKLRALLLALEECLVSEVRENRLCGGGGAWPRTTTLCLTGVARGPPWSSCAGDIRELNSGGSEGRVRPTSWPRDPRSPRFVALKRVSHGNDRASRVCMCTGK